MIVKYKSDVKSYLNEETGQTLDALARDLHASSYNAGWWHDQATGEEKVDDLFFQCSKLLLIHAETSEAAEGLRTGEQDDKLPEYTNEAVELSDIIIRALDYCGAKNIPIGEIINKKMRFNAVRSDHKVENRKKIGGKRF